MICVLFFTSLRILRLIFVIYNAILSIFYNSFHYQDAYNSLFYSAEKFWVSLLFDTTGLEKCLLQITAMEPLCFEKLN